MLSGFVLLQCFVISKMPKGLLSGLFSHGWFGKVFWDPKTVRKGLEYSNKVLLEMRDDILLLTLEDAHPLVRLNLHLKF